MHDEIFKLMGRVEGYARTIQKLAQDKAPIAEIEQQIKAVEGIVKRAKVATLRADLAGVKNADAILERVKKLI
jgi:DNA-binding FrmR family transcriptional regulator